MSYRFNAGIDWEPESKKKMTLLDTLLLVMALMFPRGEHYAAAMAYDSEVRHEAPLFEGDISREETASFLLAVGYRESGWNNDAVGDNNSSFCMMQIHTTEAREYGHTSCVKKAYELIRTSFRLCKALPIRERLAYYARGSCESSEGRRISRDRFWMASQIRVKIHGKYRGAL